MTNTNNLQIFSVTVVLLWLVVSYHTFRGIIRGDIFVAPCLKDLRRAEVQSGENESEKGEIRNSRAILV